MLTAQLKNSYWWVLGLLTQAVGFPACGSCPGFFSVTHMNRSRILGLLMILALLSAAMPVTAAEKGWFGFAVSVDAAGLLNPTLRSITIEKVFAASPAALAGLAAGDAVVEVQGIVVAGARADVLRAAMQKSVGETLRLKIRRGVGELRDVSLVAARKPPAQG